jgi:hypothetical protein
MASGVRIPPKLVRQRRQTGGHQERNLRAKVLTRPIMTKYDFYGTLSIHVLLPATKPIVLPFQDGSCFEIIFSVSLKEKKPNSETEYTFRITGIEAGDNGEAWQVAEEHFSTATGYLSSFLQFPVTGEIGRASYIDNGGKVSVARVRTVYLTDGPFPVKETKIPELINGWNGISADPALLEAMRQCAIARGTTDRIRKFWHLYIAAILLVSGQKGDERKNVDNLLRSRGVSELSKVSSSTVSIHSGKFTTAVIFRDYFSHRKEISIDGKKPDIEALLKKYLPELQREINHIVRERIVGLKSDQIIDKLQKSKNAKA